MICRYFFVAAVHSQQRKQMQMIDDTDRAYKGNRCNSSRCILSTAEVLQAKRKDYEVSNTRHISLYEHQHKEENETWL